MSEEKGDCQPLFVASNALIASAESKSVR